MVSTYQSGKDLSNTLSTPTRLDQFCLRQWNFHLLHNLKDDAVFEDWEACSVGHYFDVYLLMFCCCFIASSVLASSVLSEV